MKKVFKKLSVILGVVLSVSVMAFYGCNNNNPQGSTSNVPSGTVYATTTDDKTPYAMATSPSGKDYIVDGNGYVYTGLTAQLPTDLYVSADGEYAAAQERYFKLASDTGFNSVDIPFMWNQVEVNRDNYSDTEINTYLGYAKKYNLKVNIVWYGSLIDGQSMSYSVPEYILNNTSTYSLIKYVCERGNYGMVSVREWDDPDLLAREGKALTQLMNFIAEWNTENGDDFYKNPVVMVQLGQGADRFAKWRIEQYDVQGASGIMTAAESKVIINPYLQAMANAVKTSNYRALTRVDFCEATAATSDIVDIKGMENIDMAAPTYLHTIAQNKQAIADFNGNSKLGVMPIVNAENFPSDASTNSSVNKYLGDRQTLTTFVCGGVGHTTYYLAPAMAYPVSPYGSIYQASATNAFAQYSTAGDDMKAIHQIMNKAPHAMATINSQAITALFMDGKLSVGGTQKVYLTYTNNKYVLVETTVPSNTKALGFVGVGAVGSSIYVYIASTVDTSVKISGCSILSVSHGYQDADGAFNKEGNGVNNSGTITVQAGKLYYVKVGAVTGSSYSGYKTPAASLTK